MSATEATPLHPGGQSPVQERNSIIQSALDRAIKALEARGVDRTILNELENVRMLHRTQEPTEDAGIAW